MMFPERWNYSNIGFTETFFILFFFEIWRSKSILPSRSLLSLLKVTRGKSLTIPAWREPIGPESNPKWNDNNDFKNARLNQLPSVQGWLAPENAD